VKKIISIAGVLGALVAIMSLGAWILKAEEAHSQVQVNEKAVSELIRQNEIVNAGG